MEAAAARPPHPNPPPQVAGQLLASIADVHERGGHRPLRARVPLHAPHPTPPRTPHPRSPIQPGPFVADMAGRVGPTGDGLGAYAWGLSQVAPQPESSTA
jgi:hypothetical protein